MYDELVERLRSGSYTLEELSIILPEAADAVEELQQNIEQYKLYLQDAINDLRSAHEKEQKWIPVTERLPEKYIGEWLCCTDDGQILILPYDTPGDGSKECIFYAWDDAGCFSQTFNVTHWMPLPEPPKGVDDEHTD